MILTRDCSKRLNGNCKDAASSLLACDRLRETLGYRETLRRGYAVVRSGQALITTVAGVEAAKSLEIEFADGRIAVAQTAAARPAGRAKPKPPEQGQLF